MCLHMCTHGKDSDVLHTHACFIHRTDIYHKVLWFSRVEKFDAVRDGGKILRSDPKKEINKALRECHSALPPGPTMSLSVQVAVPDSVSDLASSQDYTQPCFC